MPIAPPRMAVSRIACILTSSSARRRPRRVAEHGGARLRLAVVAAEVDADAGLLETGEVLGDALGRHRRAAFAADRRRHAHAQLVLGQSVARQHARRTGPSCRSSRATRSGRARRSPPARALDPADPREASVANRDVRENPRIPHAVEHAAAADHEVVDGGRRLPGGGRPLQARNTTTIETASRRRDMARIMDRARPATRCEVRARALAGARGGERSTLNVCRTPCPRASSIATSPASATPARATPR